MVKGHFGPLPKSDDQFGHLISPFTLLPDDVIAQRIGQLHSLAVAEGTAPQFAGQVGDAGAPAVLVRAGMTMTEVVDYLSDEYGWSASVPNLSGKLRRGSLRYGEAVELADALGYDIIWKKRER